MLVEDLCPAFLSDLLPSIAKCGDYNSMMDSARINEGVSALDITLPLICPSCLFFRQDYCGLVETRRYWTAAEGMQQFSLFAVNQA